jgi:hypothetical protein
MPIAREPQPALWVRGVQAYIRGSSPSPVMGVTAIVQEAPVRVMAPKRGDLRLQSFPAV